ncbi:MAG: transporter [Gemmatimonadetes bacterium]|nr:transporter [Gemmatimonadota bacterium]
MPGDASAPYGTRTAIRFNRHEWSGAFGDMGTDLPLLVGMIVAAHLDAATVFLVYGALQVTTGLLYRMPMPVQPLKAVAAIVIAGGVSREVLGAGGLVIGALMLALALTGGLAWLQRAVPTVVVRGIQLGLGLQLGRLALEKFVPQDGTGGFALAAVALALVLAVRNRPTVPPALLVLPLGFAWAAWHWGRGAALGFAAPAPVLGIPPVTAWRDGLLLLALPQIALSLGNSVLATRQLAMDLFPDRAPLPLSRIGATYAFMNLVSAPLGGIPVCHGSGGMAGHYAFGARTGGSVILYGLFWFAAALMASADARALLSLFPGPILGVLLVVEAVTLLALVREVAGDARQLTLALLLALVAPSVPYGYAVALVGGTLVARWWLRPVAPVQPAARGAAPIGVTGGVPPLSPDVPTVH